LTGVSVGQLKIISMAHRGLTKQVQVYLTPQLVQYISEIQIAHLPFQVRQADIIRMVLDIGLRIMLNNPQLLTQTPETIEELPTDV
jgi:hypothetical protein